MHSQQPPGVVQNWSTLQCSEQNTEQCGYDHAPVTRGRMRAQFPLPHGPHSLITLSVSPIVSFFIKAVRPPRTGTWTNSMGTEPGPRSDCWLTTSPCWTRHGMS